jgi:hypothetical protein
MLDCPINVLYNMYIQEPYLLNDANIWLFCLWRLLKMELERVVPTIFYLNNVRGNVLKKKQNKHQNRLFWKYKVILFWFISWKHHLKIVSVLWQYAMHIHMFSPGTPISSTNKTDCHNITENCWKWR